MKMRLLGWQDDDKKAKKLRLEELLESRKIIQKVFHYQGLSYVSKIVYSELISSYYNNLLGSYFYIMKT